MFAKANRAAACPGVRVQEYLWEAPRSGVLGLCAHFYCTQWQQCFSKQYDQFTLAVAMGPASCSIASPVLILLKFNI